jgi:hypothetical protein
MSIVHTHTEMTSDEAYRELALGDPSGGWELVRGHLWEGPGMSVAHTRVTMDLVEHLLRQLDRNHYRVSVGLSRLRVLADTYHLPDVAVIPTALVRRLGENSRSLDAYAEPLPLVIEVWPRRPGSVTWTSSFPTTSGVATPRFGSPTLSSAP